MCLIRDDSVKITGTSVWKVLIHRFSGLESIYREHTWKPGWNNAYLRHEERGILVNWGFHVFLNKEDAVLECKSHAAMRQADYFRVVEFTFNRADLIATGYHDKAKIPQAVFKSLYLSDEEYKYVST